jgi:hypothetical protein
VKNLSWMARLFLARAWDGLNGGNQRSYHFVVACVEQKRTVRRVNYWDIIADTLHSLTKARLWNSRNLGAPDKDAH